MPGDLAIRAQGLTKRYRGGATILRAAWVSLAFAAPPVPAAYVVFTRRDVTS